MFKMFVGKSFTNHKHFPNIWRPSSGILEHKVTKCSKDLIFTLCTPEDRCQILRKRLWFVNVLNVFWNCIYICISLFLFNCCDCAINFLFSLFIFVCMIACYLIILYNVWRHLITKAFFIFHATNFLPKIHMIYCHSRVLRGKVQIVKNVKLCIIKRYVYKV